MGDLLDEPVVILVSLTLAAALFIIELALPTMGIAGLLAIAARQRGQHRRRGEPHHQAVPA